MLTLRHQVLSKATLLNRQLLDIVVAMSKEVEKETITHITVEGPVMTNQAQVKTRTKAGICIVHTVDTQTTLSKHAIRRGDMNVLIKNELN